MGYNARNDEIHDNIVRMQRSWEAYRDALATVRRFNARRCLKEVAIVTVRSLKEAGPAPIRHS